MCLGFDTTNFANDDVNFNTLNCKMLDKLKNGSS